MSGRRPECGHGQVAGEALRFITAQAQGFGGDQQLGGAGLVHGRQPSVVDLGEDRAPGGVVDRAAVVGVDEGVLPQLGALVHVGHAGHGQLHELGGQGVAPSGRAYPVDRRGHDHPGDGILQARHRRGERRLEGGVRRGPGGGGAGFPGRFEGVGREAVGARRPGSHDGLPEQVLERCVVQRGGLAQGRERGGPVAGNLGEHTDAGPHVFAAFGVVGRQRGHRRGQRSLALLLAGVEVGDTHREFVGVCAHFGERTEPAHPVVGGVFHSLGHDHAGGLLKPHGHGLARVAQQGQQGVDRPGQVGAAAAGPRGSVREPVGAQRQVRAVNREAGQQFGQGVDHGRVGRAAGNQAGQSSHFGAEDAVGDLAFGAVHPLGPAGRHRRGAGAFLLQRRLQRVERRLPGGVHEHPVHVGERVVAGGALGRPVPGQGLSAVQNLFHQHVGTVGVLAQPVEVPARVREAIRMVYPQALHKAAVHPAQNLGVRLVEDPGHLHAQAGQAVHGEEAAVVQLAVGPTPVDQLIVLPGMHHVGRGTVGGGSGRDRVGVVVVVQFIPDDAQLLRLVSAVTEHGNANAATARLPVHVKRLRVAGILPAGQQVPPPGVLAGSGHPHVIRHDVDQDAPPGGGRGGCQSGQARRSPAGRVDAAVVDHVVAVIGASLCREQR